MRMLIIMLVGLGFGLYCASAAYAELRVKQLVITSAVEQQKPVDNVEIHPADYDKLFCFSRIVGAADPTVITHVWYYQDHEMARVDLEVKSPDWRTYSSKRFLPQWRGEWRVEVVGEDGSVLASVPFSLQ